MLLWPLCKFGLDMFTKWFWSDARLKKIRCLKDEKYCFDSKKMQLVVNKTIFSSTILNWLKIENSENIVLRKRRMNSLSINKYKNAFEDTPLIHFYCVLLVSALCHFSLSVTTDKIPIPI